METFSAGSLEAGTERTLLRQEKSLENFGVKLLKMEDGNKFMGLL